VGRIRHRASALLGRSTNLFPGAGRVQRVFTGLHARLYSASGGRLMPGWFGAPVMLLETVGRRSRRPRRTPVIYVPDGDDLIVIASDGGSDRPPAWWLNLRAAGSGVVTIGRERREVRPRETEGAERERLWRRFAEVYPAVDDYARYTERELPVVLLEPAERSSASPSSIETTGS
jgi:deazaflavin-dependent oxidoreductase (nitroreductase family)